MSTEKCLDSKLWHACAGGMVQMPMVNSKVFYFPQGHAEHSHASVDFGDFTRIPAYVLCRVVHVKFMADPDTDEVFANISLLPINNTNIQDYNHPHPHPPDNNNVNVPDKPASFAKTLTQSDANNGGGFSVPRYCAETIFPPLDYSSDPPLQTVFAKDVHGEIWKFRHIYRGTPRRHLLTTGWSNFVNHKKLVAGDSIVFLRTENGDLCVGIRRAKRVIGAGAGADSPSGWNPATSNSLPPYGPYSAFFREDENKLIRNGNFGISHPTTPSFRGKGKVTPECVIQAATLASNAQPFQVVYYPRASTPEFCVKASSVMEATQVQWTSGMRFKMAFETEDSSRISWFMGTVSAVQVADPIRWPGSPWRLLQVTWDEPDLLQNVKRVNPWLVELVSNMPTVHLSPLMPPRKKVRLPQHPDFPFDGQFAIPSLPSNPLGPSSFLCCALDNTSAGIQGARHAQYSTSFSDLHLNKLQPGQFQAGIQRFHHTIPSSRISSSIISVENRNSDENISCLLTMGLSTHNLKKSEEKKKHQLMLFGQPILTEQQISLSFSGGPVSPVVTGNSCSDGNVEKTTANFSDGSGSAVHQQGPQENSSCEGFPWYKDRHMTEIGLETGHCKVFMESEDVGRTLDLSVLESYEELYRKLAEMFGLERSEMLSRVLYRDENGAVKHTGDESFSKFAKTTKRLTILMDSGSDNRGR